MTIINTAFAQGTHAARPAAAAGNNGYHYYETDTQTLFQSTGSVWTQIAAAASITGSGAMTQIQQQTVTGSVAANITFSTISGSYNELLLSLVARSDVAATTDIVEVQVNTDTGANYYRQSIKGNGTAATVTQDIAASNFVAAVIPGNTGPSNGASRTLLRFPQYANTHWFKQIECESGGMAALTSGNLNAFFMIGWWNSTAAITTIKLFLQSGNFAVNSVATLWGIT